MDANFIAFGGGYGAANASFILRLAIVAALRRGQYQTRAAAARRDLPLRGYAHLDFFATEADLKADRT